MTVALPEHAEVMLAEIRAVVAPTSKGDVVEDTVVDLQRLEDVLIDPTGIMGSIDRISSVMPAVGRVTLQQIVMSSPLLCSLRNTNESFQTMLRIRLNQGGLKDGVQPLGTPQRNLVK